MILDKLSHRAPQWQVGPNKIHPLLRQISWWFPSFLKTPVEETFMSGQGPLISFFVLLREMNQSLSAFNSDGDNYGLGYIN